MDIPIVIPCFFATDESRQAAEMSDMIGRESSQEEMDELYSVRNVYLFNVDYVFQHDNEHQTLIGCGDELFRTPLSINEVLKQLK